MHADFQEVVLQTMASPSPERMPCWALGLCSAQARLASAIECGEDPTLQVGEVLWYSHALLICLREPADVVLPENMGPQEPDWQAPGRIAGLVQQHVYGFKPLDTARLLRGVRSVVAGCVGILHPTPLPEAYRQYSNKLMAQYG